MDLPIFPVGAGYLSSRRAVKLLSAASNAEIASRKKVTLPRNTGHFSLTSNMYRLHENSDHYSWSKLSVICNLCCAATSGIHASTALKDRQKSWRAQLSDIHKSSSSDLDSGSDTIAIQTASVPVKSNDHRGYHLNSFCSYPKCFNFREVGPCTLPRKVRTQ